ncbi:MAG TPA: hypothetical protein VID72_12290, partial [Ktedonobacterales bacterium]
NTRATLVQGLTGDYNCWLAWQSALLSAAPLGYTRLMAASDAATRPGAASTPPETGARRDD